MPLPLHASSIMGDETHNNHDENRTIYEPLHSTQSFVPSCIMFPLNTPHVELSPGLLKILPDFRGQENENPHVKASEEIIVYMHKMLLRLLSYTSFLFPLRKCKKLALHIET